MSIAGLYKQIIFAMFFMAMFTSFASSPAFAGKQVYTELLKVADVKKSGAYVRTRFLKIMKKPFTSEGKKKALIIGDSHAQDFLNSVLESDQLQNYQISTRYIPTRCQIFLGENMDRFIEPKDKALCEESDNLSQAKKQIEEADVVVLAANWKEWSAKILPSTIKNLELAPEQKLFVIGRKSFGKVKIRKYLRMPEDKLGTLRNKVESHHNLINNIMSKTLSDEVFINLHSLVCGESSDCPVFTSDLKLISFDGGHLTKDGARYVGKIIFKHSKLAEL